MTVFLTNNISEYRNALMGIGILSVLAVHLNIMGYLPPICGAFLEDSSMFVYVEGFFFLSGFGLYHSFSKNSHLSSFYIKRTKRLFIPYLILMSPYIIITGFIDKENIGLIISRLLGVSFWYEGNYSGMWFIHVLLLLYLAYPFLHKFLFEGNKYFYIKALSLIILFSITLYGMKTLAPSYFPTISFALYRIPFYVFGAWIAYESKRDNSICWLFLWFFSYIVITIANYSEIENLRKIFMMSFFLPLWGCAVSFIHKNNINSVYKILNWFGKYTLEIYILHMMLMWVGLRIGINVRISIISAEVLSILLCHPAHKFATKFCLNENKQLC